MYLSMGTIGFGELDVTINLVRDICGSTLHWVSGRDTGGLNFDRMTIRSGSALYLAGQSEIGLSLALRSEIATPLLTLLL